MQVLNWQELDAGARRTTIARPAAGHSARIRSDALGIIDQVRRDGAAALLALTARFDHAKLSQLQVSDTELTAARNSLPGAAITAIERAIGNVRRFHAATATAPVAIDVEPGVHCERLIRPLQAVGLYVPAGSAPLPSTAIMLAVPATLAGCPVRVVCTPPRADGTADPAVLVAASLAGATAIFKLGGVQAIAAMAYGIAPLPKVCKVFGPGNAWVTAAKQLVAEDANGAALDMPAGPSEVMVIADDSAQPQWIAADLLAQAEHDPLSQAILLTDSAQIARATATAVRAQIAQLSRQSILRASVAALRIVCVPDLATAFAIAEDYAPEHLIIETREPRHWLARINTAGSVFLGHYTPESMGDYCSGTNHVLPTYGHARAYSGLGLSDFQRRMTVQELSGDGLRSLGPTAVTLARLEGLDAHANAVNIRLAATGAMATN
jgi:histidinol dehydrogenase